MEIEMWSGFLPKIICLPLFVLSQVSRFCISNTKIRSDESFSPHFSPSSDYNVIIVNLTSSVGKQKDLIIGGSSRMIDARSVIQVIELEIDSKRSNRSCNKKWGGKFRMSGLLDRIPEMLHRFLYGNNDASN